MTPDQIAEAIAALVRRHGSTVAGPPGYDLSPEIWTAIRALAERLARQTHGITHEQEEYRL
jgi:hypothetical protein